MPKESSRFVPERFFLGGSWKVGKVFIICGRSLGYEIQDLSMTKPAIHIYMKTQTLMSTPSA
jgi:hypothetical protein